MKRMNRTSEASVVNSNSSEKKDIGTSSSRRNELISNNAWSNAFVSSAGKTCDAECDPGPENGRSVDSLSYAPEEFVSHSAQLQDECGDSNEEPLPDNIERDPEVNENHYVGTADALASDALPFKNHNSSKNLEYIERSKHGKVALSECTSDDNTDNRMLPLCTYIHPMVEHCPTGTQTLDLNSTLHSQQSHFKLLEAKKELPDKFTVGTSQPSDEQMQHILSMWHKEKSALIESPLSGNGISLKRRKGKERVSMEKDDSHESAESSNSKEPRARGKRAWSYGQETLMESKRMQKLIDNNPCSRSHIRENSSFMNWISSVMKGSFRSDHVEKHSLSFIPHPVASTPSNLFQFCKSNGSDHSADACKGMGFGSIFQSLYCPISGKPMKTVSPDYQEECVDFKKLHFNDRPGGSVKAVPRSSMTNDQGNYQFREPSLAAPSISMRSSPIEEKTKHNIEYCNLCNVGSSSSSFQNGSSSPSEGKEVGKLGIFEPNKFSNLLTKNKAGRFPATLWITRFLPKVTAPTPCEKLTDDRPKFPHHSQNEIVSVRDCRNSENGCRSSEDQRPFISGHEYSGSLMSSCGFKKVDNDLKIKYNLNPILPSQTLKKLVPMTTVFAKRLDAFRHINTSDVQDDVTSECETCFFCGKDGHRLTACSDVNESELEDLMQKMNSHGRAEKPFCVCIHCFMHDHRAVTWPYESLGPHCSDHNKCHINPKNFVSKIKQHGSDNSLIGNYDVGMCSNSDDGPGHVLSAHGIPCGEISMTVSEVQKSINMDIIDIINSNGSALNSYLTKDGHRKNEAKGKQVASTSTVIESIDNPLIQIIDINDEPDKQCLIFERIRKLRLSRTEIIRWMGSSFSHFSLIGFFLRVKIEKWGEDLGGTGYHVACIGGLGEKLSGYSKNHLPVDVGGLRCLINCRFISNDDFVEDELKAWWSATQRRGGKLPSEEGLDRKLEEKEKFGL